MTLRVDLSDEADSDIDEIHRFIGRDSPDAADRFVKSAFDTIDVLALRPAIGTIREADNPKLRGLRSFRVRGFSNYLIFYIADEHALRVVRICHGAQDLEAIFE